MELILHVVLQPQTVFLKTGNTVVAIGLFAFQKNNQVWQAKQFLWSPTVHCFGLAGSLSERSLTQLSHGSLVPFLF